MIIAMCDLELKAFQLLQNDEYFEEEPAKLQEFMNSYKRASKNREKICWNFKRSSERLQVVIFLLKILFLDGISNQHFVLSFCGRLQISKNKRMFRICCILHFHIIFYGYVLLLVKLCYLIMKRLN